MSQVNVHEAKTHLSKLLTRVAAGEEIIISKARQAHCSPCPVEPEYKAQDAGLDRGLLQVPDDFDAPLPPEVLKALSRENPSRYALLAVVDQ